jgi:riboflavin kinase/FMN adenylyltransferase
VLSATLTFLGTGTSMGVPTLGCNCAVCRSAMTPAPEGDPHNRRTRPSLRLQWKSDDAQQIPHTVLIDTGPDFHAQALREGITRVDAVFYTHHHADHILGMDDLRPLSFRNTQDLPLYADQQTADSLRRIFGYTFRTENRYATSARVSINLLPSEVGAYVSLFGAEFQPIPVIHGQERITGFRFGSAAYLTDLSDLPSESFALLQDLDILIIDALRRKPHPSHSHLEKSLSLVEQLKPRRAFFTHMSHELDHAATNALLPPHVRLAYDGLQLEFNIAPHTTTPHAARHSSMQIFRSLAELPESFGDVVATIGNFDGVHRGHAWVFEQVLDRARTLGLPALAVTFEPHPVRILRPEAPHSLITPLEEKLDLLACSGFDAALVLPFTPEISHLTAEQFAREILRDRIHVREVHEGENFRFGYRATTDMQGLKALGRELGFDVTCYPPWRLRGAPVSSSRIRTLIAAGQVSAARALLGRAFSIRSTPAAGRGYGTRYTVPTINLAPYGELLPANGVYITTLTVGTGPTAECFEGVTNVGNRPTFGADSFTVESHLLNFRPLALDETTPVELAFLHHLREERQWPTPEALRQQIGRDVAHAQRFFALSKALAANPREPAARPAL